MIAIKKIPVLCDDLTNGYNRTMKNNNKLFSIHQVFSSLPSPIDLVKFHFSLEIYTWDGTVTWV